MKSFNFKNLLMVVGLAVIASSTTAMAESKSGGDSGGGGDASETRVNEIRSDILKWINDGGAKKLTLPEGMKYESYFEKMTAILESKKVIVGFVEEVITVNGVEKTCKGFLAETDGRENIRCNISRFSQTSEADQYSLIHHEYAGLARIEKNDGASSDYEISSQLTGFLEEATVLKLVVKEPEEVDTEEDPYNPARQVLKNVAICSTECHSEQNRGHDLAVVGRITYAPATQETLSNRWACEEKSKTIVVYNDRMQGISDKTCADALLGKYYGIAVDIDNSTPPKKGDEEFGYIFTIKKSKKTKK